MAENDLDLIPTLDDIIVPGDPSKTPIGKDQHTHAANIQDLASTGHFNALFEPATEDENWSDIDAAQVPAIENADDSDSESVTNNADNSTSADVVHINTPTETVVDGMLLSDTSEITVTNDTAALNQEPPTEVISPVTNEINDATAPPQIDIELLVKNIMQDMMPHLEIQIRAQLMSSLAKHLPESTIIFDSDDDNDINQTP